MCTHTQQADLERVKTGAHRDISQDCGRFLHAWPDRNSSARVSLQHCDPVSAHAHCMCAVPAWSECGAPNPTSCASD